jgi:peptidoglycan hydrolase-like protein with peptidoglycan-binding domain
MSWVRGWALSCLFLSLLSPACMSVSRWQARPSAPTSRPAGAPSSAPRPDLAVRQIQGILYERGYNPGPIDGLMGNKTRTALRQFQVDQNLPATGYIDAQTRATLLQQPTDSPKQVSGGVEP